MPPWESRQRSAAFSLACGSRALSVWMCEVCDSLNYFPDNVLNDSVGKSERRGYVRRRNRIKLVKISVRTRVHTHTNIYIIYIYIRGEKKPPRESLQLPPRRGRLSTRFPATFFFFQRILPDRYFSSFNLASARLGSPCLSPSASRCLFCRGWGGGGPTLSSLPPPTPPADY